MRYGRQRWKLRGRIEVNSKQVWDSEDMVFLPLITEFLSIKVTAMAQVRRSLGSRDEAFPIRLHWPHLFLLPPGHRAEEPGQPRGGGKRLL